MIVLVRGGYLYRISGGDGILVGRFKGDEIAKANGLDTMDEFARKFDGQTLDLSIKLKIKAKEAVK